MTDIISAIIALKADAEVSVNAEDINKITWHDGNPTKITNKQITDKQAELNQASYEKIAKEFSEIPAVKQLGQSSIGLWKAMVYNATKGRIPEDGIPNTEQLKLLKIVADRSGSALSKNRGGLAKAVYLPEEILKDLPFTKDWIEAVQASDQRYKGDI